MDSLQIDTGEKRIAINGDENRVIVFNPSDTIFREKFYRLIGDFQTKLTEYQVRGVALDEKKELDANGLPINMSDRLALEKESCLYIRQKIDELFGEGTSQKAFDDSMVLRFEEKKPGPFEQFFSGIMSYVQKESTQKVQKYSNKKQKRTL